LAYSPVTDINWILTDPGTPPPPPPQPLDILEDGGTYSIRNVNTGLYMTRYYQIFNGKIMDAMVAMPNYDLDTQKFKIEKIHTYDENSSNELLRGKTDWSIKVFESLSGYSEFMQLSKDQLTLKDFDANLPLYYLYDTFYPINEEYSSLSSIDGFFFDFQKDGSYIIDKYGTAPLGVYDLGPNAQSPVVSMYDNTTWELVPVPDIPFDGNVYNDPVVNDGVYTVQNLNSGYSMSNNTRYINYFTDMIQSMSVDPNNSYNFEFKLRAIGNNLWTILYRNSSQVDLWDRAIEVGGNLYNASNGAIDKDLYKAMSASADPSKQAQQFILERQQDGSYRIKSALPNTNLYLIVYQRGLSDGEGIVFGDYKASSLWLFNPSDYLVSPPPSPENGNYAVPWGLFNLGWHVGLTKEVSDNIYDALKIGASIATIASLLAKLIPGLGTLISIILKVISAVATFFASILHLYTTANGVWINIYGIPVGFGGR